MSKVSLEDILSAIQRLERKVDTLLAGSGKGAYKTSEKPTAPCSRNDVDFGNIPQEYRRVCERAFDVDSRNAFMTNFVKSVAQLGFVSKKQYAVIKKYLGQNGVNADDLIDEEEDDDLGFDKNLPEDFVDVLPQDKADIKDDDVPF